MNIGGAGAREADRTSSSTIMELNTKEQFSSRCHQVDDSTLDDAGLASEHEEDVNIFGVAETEDLQCCCRD